MILIVETNVVLEIVIEQAEAEQCRKILELCGSGGIVLAIPSFSIAEAMQKVERRRSERRESLKALQPHIRELDRAEPLVAYAALIRQLQDELLKAEAGEGGRLSSFVNDTMTKMMVIPLSPGMLLNASGITAEEDQQRALSASDAIVWASVLDHLRGMRSLNEDEEICFVTRDRDFDRDTVREALQQLNCRLMLSFIGALGFIESRQ
jgi:predicted nucleic acid-binding protein